MSRARKAQGRRTLLQITLRRAQLDGLLRPSHDQSPRPAVSDPTGRACHPHLCGPVNASLPLPVGPWGRAGRTRPDAVLDQACLHLALALQLRAHPDIDRERLRRRDHAGVGQHVRYRKGDRRLRIEESAESREFAIEQVVYDPVDLPLLGELVRAVQVRDPVVGELGVLVGVVANKPLAADPDDVGAEFQLRRNPIVGATFDLVPRYAGNLLAWRDEDVSVRVWKGIVRRCQLSVELISGIDESIVGVDEVLSHLVVGTRFQPLAACKWNVLEYAAALKHARDSNDVVLAVGMEQPELPVAATAAAIDVSTEPGLYGFRNHLSEDRTRGTPPTDRAFAGLSSQAQVASVCGSLPNIWHRTSSAPEVFCR